jgi:MFS family permease
VVFAGIFLGAYAWGIVSDIHGRRLGFIATALFTFLFGMLSAWSPDYWFLLVSRAFVGFGLGGSPVSPIVLLHILNSLVISLSMSVYPIIQS